MTVPLPANGDTSWDDWAAYVDGRVAGNGAAGTPTTRSIGTGALEAMAGNTVLTIADASETVKGKVELADATEAAALADLTKAISPGRLAALLAGKVDTVVTTITVSTTTYTLALSDWGKDIEFTNAAGCAVTVPLNATVAVPTGSFVTFWQRGAAQVVVGGPGAGAGGGTAGGVTIESRGSVFKTAGLNAEAQLKKRATDGHLYAGDISS